MGRTALVYLVPATLVAVAWLRLESPRVAGIDALAVVSLALLPALLPGLRLRVGAAIVALAGAAWVAFDASPFAARPFDESRAYFGPLGSAAKRGFREFYDVLLPFSGASHPGMHGVLIAAVFAFCLALSLAVAARKPLLAALVVAVGAGWPVTLLPSGHGLVVGGGLLAATLCVVAGSRRGAFVPAVGATALLVAVAVVVSSSAAVAKGGLLAWQKWDFYNLPRDPVGVAYVWDGRYGGIDFPKEKTTVLRIHGPKRGLYWRATTLDTFIEDRWIENLYPLVVSDGTRDVPPDPFEPAAAADPKNWIRQDVEVVALRDEHFVAASVPQRIAAPGSGSRVFFLNGGVVRTSQGLQPGQEYTVWSYASQPKPAELARAGTEYPDALLRYLSLGRAQMERFGLPGREARLEQLFQDERQLQLWPYEIVYRRAVALAGRSSSPYAAVVAIEAWLRVTGGFAYDEHPPQLAGSPPLAAFVATTKVGYCQQFAGAMALMLRFLGIPARVAVGFTSGSYSKGIWTVTDHNAHAWVEAWFPGHGWLPFDPTPGRGTLSASYTVASANFDARGAIAAIRAQEGTSRGGLDPGGAGQLALLSERSRERAQPAAGDGVGSLLRVLAGLALLAAIAIGVAKLAVRRWRYATRDPRLIAAAARRELTGFLADQGVAVPSSATPGELRLLVEAALQVDARGFTGALSAARFGPPGQAADAARRARRELRSLLHVASGRLTTAQRVRGFVTLRSLRA